MSVSYYIRSQGKVAGPFSFEDLKGKAAKGHLKKTDQVSADRKTWQSARAVEGLFAPPPKPPQQASAEAIPAVRVEPELVEVKLIEEEPLEVAVSVEETEWHYCLPGDEQTQGPVSESKLRKLFQSGKLPWDTLVWNDTLSDWVEAHRIPVLSKSSARGGADPVMFAEVPLMDSSPGYGTPGQRSVPPWATISLISGILAILLGITAIIFLTMKAKTGFLIGALVPAYLAAILAVVLGHIAWGQLKTNRNAASSRDLAKAGLIVGYISMGILILGGGIWMTIKMMNG